MIAWNVNDVNCDSRSDEGRRMIPSLVTFLSKMNLKRLLEKITI